MSVVYFWLFLIINGFSIVFACRRRDGVFQFHFLAALVLIGWAAPQLLGLLRDSGLPPGAVDRLLIYACLCSLAIIAGGVLPIRRVRPVLRRLGERSDLLVAGVVGGIGLVAFAMVRSYVATHGLDLNARWTGPVTIMQFFSQLVDIGFALGVLCWLRTRSMAAAAIALATGLVYIYLIVWLGRRGPTVEFVLALSIAVWHVRRLSMPVPVMILLAAVGSLLFYSVGEYRQIVFDQGVSLSAIKQIDFLAGIRTIAEGNSVELKNALYFIDLVHRSFSIDFGASIWNRFIDLYVPGQIVGHDLKEALKFTHSFDLLTEFGYRTPVGSTFTGFADSFGAFGYFGCLLFFAMARILTHIWHRASAGDDAFAVLYILVVTPGLHGITHNIGWFFSFLPLYGLFYLVPILMVSDKRRFIRYRVAAPAAGPTVVQHA